MFPPALAALPWKYIGIGLLALAAVFGILQYGAAKFDAGEAHADAKWQAAAKKLEAQSEGAADAASKPADQREAVYVETLTKEKELIDEAIARGDSPLDALFGVRPDTGGGADPTG
jgi:hypothetical protein